LRSASHLSTDATLFLCPTADRPGGSPLITLRPLSIVLLATLSILAAGCLQREYRVEVGYEVDEPSALAHAALGQRTCLLEAREQQSTGPCPRVETGDPRIPLATLVLDDFYTTIGAPNAGAQRDNYEDLLSSQNPSEMLDRGDPAALVTDGLGGSNPRRGTQGAMNDVILPGFGTFWAALGYWDDRDGDGVVRLSQSFSEDDDDPDSEWSPRRDARLYSWVEPGPRPAWSSAYAPPAHHPDFTYHLRGYTLYLAGAESSDVLVFPDGSLAQSMRVATASDPVLAPSSEGLPFTPTEHSRVDIDAYSAIAGGPVAAIYASVLAPTVNAYGNPSWGWCPNACRLPFGTGVDPVDGGLDGVYDLAYPRAAPEWTEGSGSSAAGRREDFTDTYRGWIDVRPATRIPGPPSAYVVNFGIRFPTVESAAVAASPQGWDPQQGTTIGPGYFAFDLWMGVWKDIDGDGFIGSAAKHDPYEGGRRPDGNDYLQPGSEFVGAFPAEQPNGENFQVRLIPDEGWGPGVYQMNTGGTPSDVYSRDPNSGACMDPSATHVAGVCLRPVDRGKDTLTLAAGVDRSFGSDGYYRSIGTLFLPFGSPGFTICTPTFTMRHETGGVLHEDPIYDCDHLARYEAR